MAYNVADIRQALLHSQGFGGGRHYPRRHPRPHYVRGHYARGNAAAGSFWSKAASFARAAAPVIQKYAPHVLDLAQSRLPPKYSSALGTVRGLVGVGRRHPHHHMRHHPRPHMVRAHMVRAHRAAGRRHPRRHYVRGHYARGNVAAGSFWSKAASLARAAAPLALKYAPSALNLVQSRLSPGHAALLGTVRNAVGIGRRRPRRHYVRGHYARGTMGGVLSGGVLSGGIESHAMRSHAARMRAEHNPWLEHVQMFRHMHPHLTYAQALHAARPSYHHM